MAEKRPRDDGTVVLCSSIFRNNSCILKNRLYSFDHAWSWEDVLRDLSQELEDPPHKTEEITISLTSKSQGEVFHPDLLECIGTAQSFDPSLKYVTFTLSSTGPVDENNNSSAVDAFSVLMTSASKLSKKPLLKATDGPRYTAKDRLFNDVVKEFIREDALFPQSYPQESIQRHVQVLTDALWYLDGSRHKLQARTPLPRRFIDSFDDVYNDFKSKKKAAPKLSSEQLKQHSGLLFRLIGMSFASSWGHLRKDVESLALAMDDYASFLDQSNDQQKSRQLLTEPVRQVVDHASCQFVPACNGPIQNKYSILDNVFTSGNVKVYEPVYFDEVTHLTEPFKSRQERHRFLTEMVLSVNIDILRYDPGGGLGATVFFWRVADNDTPTQMMTAAVKIMKSLEERLPEYHTREMKRDFVRKYSNVAGTTIPPHILRAMYAELTLDASSDQNPAIDNRMRNAILGDDPELIVDLRHLNKGRPSDSFEIFFTKLEKLLEEYTAADERRHNIEHFSKFLSIRDLIEQVKKDCPADTPIPSESTVLFAFVPKNAYSSSSKLYKSRLQLQHKIQTRQLRASHMDEHFCAAVFRYLREYATKFKDICTFLCLDDKSKIDYGEPGLAVSTGVRGKKSIVPVSSVLSALDHDVQTKGSLTPSVCLDIDVPESMSDSFYRGQVFVTLKDSVFQASSPFRHAVEMCKMLQQREAVKPVLLLYTDGGPDHRLTYPAVKLSLIVLFKVLNLDTLIAARTAPGHSWGNPCERVMSLLNIAYQNCALYRNEMKNSSSEQMVKACSGMSDIRKKAEKEPTIKTQWMESLEDLTNLLSERTRRVVLKGKPFKVLKSASEEEVTEFEAQVKQLVDPEIILGKYTQNDLKRLEDYQHFMTTHCIERTYSFQIRKCQKENCCGPVVGYLPPELPTPMVKPEDKAHYQPMESLLGKETDESDMPSKTNTTVTKVAEEQQGIQNKYLVGQNVRYKVTCYECEKPRCVYSRKNLSTREERAFRRLTERTQYTCGSLITHDGDFLQGTVFVRLQLCCASPIEFPYYAAPDTSRIGRRDICCHCGTQGVQPDQNLKRRFKIVLPVCGECLAKGKEILKRNPLPNGGS